MSKYLPDSRLGFPASRLARSSLNPLAHRTACSYLWEVFEQTQDTVAVVQQCIMAWGQLQEELRREGSTGLGCVGRTRGWNPLANSRSRDWETRRKRLRARRGWGMDHPGWQPLSTLPVKVTRPRHRAQGSSRSGSPRRKRPVCLIPVPPEAGLKGLPGEKGFQASRGSTLGQANAPSLTCSGVCLSSHSRLKGQGLEGLWLGSGHTRTASSTTPQAPAQDCAARVRHSDLLKDEENGRLLGILISLSAHQPVTTRPQGGSRLRGSSGG